MKRTLTGIVAASMVLGSFAPAALAATSSKTQWQYNTLEINGKAAISNVPSTVYQNTTYISVYDMQQYLNKLGYKATWNVNTMNVTVSGSPDLSSLPQTSGNAIIQVNGKTAMKVNHIVAQPTGWSQKSSFVPIYDFQLLLDALGINQKWDGATHTWNATTAPQADQLAITGAPTSNVAVGQQVSLGLTNDGSAVTDGVTWTTGNGAVVNNGNFIASAPGTYTVTATYGGKSATATITVYGQAAGIKLAPATSSLVADGTSTDTITATVVDANDNTVSNYTGTFTINGTSSGGLLDSNNDFAPYILTGNGALVEGGTVDGGTETFKVVNGVAKITVVAPDSSKVGDSDTLVANFTDANGNHQSASATVSYVAPVPTSFNLDPASSTIAPGSSNVNIPIEVLDQNGNPITDGSTYTVTATVSGSAYFPGDVQTEQFTFNAGNGSVAIDTPSYVSSGSAVLSVSGTAADGTTLKSSSVTLNVAQPGTASKLALALPTDSQYLVNGKMNADDAASHNVSLTGKVEDANGLAETTGPSSVSYKVTLNGQTVDSGTVDGSNGTFSVPFGEAETTAGTYTITVSASGLTSATQTVTVVPGAPSYVGLTPSVPSDVTYGSPTETVTAQLYDAEGNQVSAGNVPVSFYFAATPTTGSELNGSTGYSSGSPLVVDTDSNGSASAVVTLPQQNGASATVDATASYDNTTLGEAPSDSTPAATGAITEVATTITSVKVKPGQTSAFTAGVPATEDAPVVTITPEDSYGDLANGDVIQVTVPKGLFGGADISDDFYDAGTNTAIAGVTAVANSNNLVYDVPSDGNAIAIQGVAPVAVGTYTVSAEDISSPSTPSGSASVSVTKGSLDGFNFFDASGTNLNASGNDDSIAANGSLPLTLTAVDAEGNPVAVDGTYTVKLPTLGPDVEFRTSLSGGPVTTVTFTPGQTSQTLYLVNGTSNSVTFGNNSDDYDATSVSGAPEVAVFGTADGDSTLAVDGVAASEYPYTDGDAWAASKTYTVSVTVLDSVTGKPLADQAVYLSGDLKGTLNASVVYTNAAGVATFTYTTPAQDESGTDVVDVSVDGGTAGNVSPVNTSVTFNN